MKRLIIILLLLLPLAGVAKGGEFSDFVKRYSGQKGFTTVELSSQMLATMGVGDGIESMYAISVEDSTKVENYAWFDIEAKHEDNYIATIQLKLNDADSADSY